MLSLMLWLSHAGAEQLGEVDTVFKLLSPNHKIVVDAHDDPKVSGVTCYVSRAKTGGFKGAVGFAEDKAEASIACHQGRAISFLKPLTIQCAARPKRVGHTGSMCSLQDIYVLLSRAMRTPPGLQS